MSRPIDRLPPLRETVARAGLSAKKALGQNFLFDLNLTRRIARAGLAEGASVIEVGPGPGGLTRALLAEGALHVLAIERDARCLPILAELSAAAPGQLTIIEADAILADEAALIAAHRLQPPVRVISNLPYNAGTALLIKWLTSPSWPPFWQSLTLMFQREVAERIAAPPDSEHYGRLSVLAQWRAEPRLLFDVHPSAFTPPPSVTSTVVQLTPLTQPRAEAGLAALEAVTRAAFSQRRKMLRSSLKSLSVPPTILLDRAGIDGTRRAETLSIAEFAALARAYAAIARDAGGEAQSSQTRRRGTAP
ncbi:MAG: 16S rRNA (adenine(1518)-N(6)/adenine(1519)-N(6))-dimethyltransferase RsmA [Alphaproteobacteria bacterium]|nr:16S rRNA (adenine(1518)-N(6)/adenine(1519)-N(6))-dimethyltransferase RsmA [Alphaproteobacteria bacterium]